MYGAGTSSPRLGIGQTGDNHSMIKEQIQGRIKVAVKSHQHATASLLRTVLADIKNAEIEKGPGSVLTFEEEITVVTRQKRQYEEALDAAHTSGRDALISKATTDFDLVCSLLPPPLTEEEVREIIAQSIVDVRAEGIKDLGKVMKRVTPLTKGRFDGKAVTDHVRTTLSQW